MALAENHRNALKAEAASVLKSANGSSNNNNSNSSDRARHQYSDMLNQVYTSHLTAQLQQQHGEHGLPEGEKRGPPVQASGEECHYGFLQHKLDDGEGGNEGEGGHFPADGGGYHGHGHQAAGYSYGGYHNPPHPSLGQRFGGNHDADDSSSMDNHGYMTTAVNSQYLHYYYYRQHMSSSAAAAAVSSSAAASVTKSDVDTKPDTVGKSETNLPSAGNSPTSTSRPRPTSEAVVHNQGEEEASFFHVDSGCNKFSVASGKEHEKKEEQQRYNKKERKEDGQ